MHKQTQAAGNAMRLDLSSKSGAERFMELRRAEMARLFARIGSLPGPVAWVIATRDPRDATDLDSRGVPRRPLGWLDAPEAIIASLPAWMYADLGPVQSKKAYARCLHAFADMVGAIGVVVFMETWVSLHRVKPGEPDPDTNPEDDPERGECITCMVEHEALGQQLWQANIKRDPLRVEAWTKEAYGEGGVFTGRFTGFIK